MSFNNILMLYYLTVLVYTKTTTHISINGGYLKRHFAADCRSDNQSVQNIYVKKKSKFTVIDRYSFIFCHKIPETFFLKYMLLFCARFIYLFDL